MVLVHGTARMLTREELPAEVGDAFAAKHGWDPRKDRPSYAFFQVTPQVLQVWGTVPEMAGRTMMRDGKWLVRSVSRTGHSHSLMAAISRVAS
ncbi:hypothetical protein ACWD0J_29425 [Streptomyces sp. NPDC003011]